jgi:uncharacterized protein involved in cysteine biosynthesis
MDWIQWLTVVLLAVNVLAVLVYTAKQSTPQLVGHFIGALLILPVYGRVLGWW